MTLPPDWLKDNPTFVLEIPLKPRFVSPHPYANQDILALARGPLIYCMEDVDNPWVDDHFKSLVIDPTNAINETVVSGEVMGEPYVGLTIDTYPNILRVDTTLSPRFPLNSLKQEESKAANQLHFIPYALRDNRGGKGHMRVGIRRKR